MPPFTRISIRMKTPRVRSNVRGLIAYLQAEATFMQECRDDYRDAASNVLRVA